MPERHTAQGFILGAGHTEIQDCQLLLAEHFLRNLASMRRK